MQAMTELHRMHTETIRAEVAQGVVDGLTAILADKKLVETFWRRGYEELASHSSAGASQWFGKRALTAAVIMLVVWGIGWLFRSGAIK